MIQRLGRVNRDGRDNEAEGYFWEVSKPEKRKHEGETWIGPYREQALEDAKVLVETMREASAQMSFTMAVDVVRKKEKSRLDKALELEPPLEPHPRALDVHGLFSTEPDMHGGFTDISRFVRGSDPDADVTVLWRAWSGDSPPEGDDLDGPPFQEQEDGAYVEEGCQIPVNRLREAPEGSRDAWVWNEKDERWDRYARNDLVPGMVVMLNADAGGYSTELGWTGRRQDTLQGLPPPGPGRALRRDERVQMGYWAPIAVHLTDARTEAERICDGVGLLAEDEGSKWYRAALVEAAGLHDIGKLHPDWQAALPAGDAMGGGPWAKCPFVLRVEPADLSATVRAKIEGVLPDALALAPRQDADGNDVGLRWAVDRKLRREELERIRGLAGIRKAVHEAFRPGLRHEAASALAMWRRYRDGRASYPALAVYLAAAHHGKVRTVLRSIKDDGDDVFGVRPSCAHLIFNDRKWPMDFTVARDGAKGEWREEVFVLTDHGWTGLVADLLGPWRGEPANAPAVGVVPESELHHLGPLVLAWLEALVRIADWRASDCPSESVKPSEVCDGK